MSEVWRLRSDRQALNLVLGHSGICLLPLGCWPAGVQLVGKLVEVSKVQLEK